MCMKGGMMTRFVLTRYGATLLAGLALAACDDGDGDGGGAGGVVVIGGQGGEGGAGGMGGEGPDLVEAYCTGVATAKCEYVFKCVEGAARRTIFGLDGPELGDCVAGEAERCLTDAQDRAERGTLRPIEQTEIDQCQSRLGALACPPGAPDDWVTMFYQFYGNACSSIGIGMVPEGGACARRSDCQDRTQICDGTCRAPRPADIMADCEPTGATPGALNADMSCVGETCARLGANAIDKTGICTVDCTEGFGCPSGAYCLRSSSLGGVATWYCTWPCEDDDDCEGGFECAPINPDEPEKHCAARLPE